jgi:hypothetical protein
MKFITWRVNEKIKIFLPFTLKRIPKITFLLFRPIGSWQKLGEGLLWRQRASGITHYPALFPIYSFSSLS